MQRPGYVVMLRAPRATVIRARNLRRSMSLPEGLLWRSLRTRPDGFKFRKQHPAGPYVLDFFCVEAALCIEIDGRTHDSEEQADFDASRTAWLRLHDIETLRLPASAVLDDVNACLVHIVAAARARLPLHHDAARRGPPPRDRGGTKGCP